MQAIYPSRIACKPRPLPHPAMPLSPPTRPVRPFVSGHSSFVIPRRNRRGAFTLIELLTVIAIIGILAAILIPTVGKMRESAVKTTCSTNLRQLALGTLAFANDHRGALPLRPAGTPAYAFPHAFVSADWDTFSPYVGNAPKAKLMFCPGPLQEWRNTEVLGYAATGPDANYTTYSYFGNLPLKAAVVSGYGLAANTLKQLNTLPLRFPLWTCLTYRSGGRLHGHSDPDTADTRVQGQNAARTDASVVWVKGDSLVSYYENAAVDFLAPTP